jgi:hypothetical protein
MRAYFEGEIDGDRVTAPRWQEEILEPKFLDKFQKVHRELTEMGIKTVLYD